ncbi:MAG TPA: hypothetical protein EYQ50_18230 [Verrucomicrobiales bacterium]|nr:hypothetical protein [Verrucomicrobiales bacterium]
MGASIWVLQVGLSLMALGGVWNWVIPHRNGSASNKIDQPDSSVAPTFDTEKNIRETQAEWERLAQKIEQRDRDLSEKLKTFHEWMEFPLPSNLAEMSSTSKVSNEDLAEKDQQLLQLLEEESKRIFERILHNEYSIDGQVQIGRIRDDSHGLILRIARIYQPDVEQPLLEINLSQILHAASRVCLQFLVVAESLPLDVKDYSFQSIYDYISKAVRAYGVYRSFDSFKPYVNTAFYLGRFAMGANPVSLGAWWVIGNLGKQGAAALTKNFVHQQALAFLHNLIRVIGYEVAGIYGGDFRHRDPNWIYAAELTELIHHFPISRKSLAHGLNEIGRLSLRSEYDRIYLYRCLAAHKSAGPGEFLAPSVLTVAERRQVATRLERVFHESIPGRTGDLIEDWKKGVEDRLSIKLSLDAETATRQSATEEAKEAARSLAGFIVGIKEREPGELPELLKKTRVYCQMEFQDRSAWLNSIEANPPFFFEPPDLDPKSDFTRHYLMDLKLLAVELPPINAETLPLLEEVAHFLNQDPKRIRADFESELVRHMSRQLSPDQPNGQMMADAALVLAHLLEPEELPWLVYRGIKIGSSSIRRHKPSESILFFATKKRCGLVTLGDSSERIWEGGSNVTIEEHTRLRRKHYRITGGQWLDNSIRRNRWFEISCPLLSRSESFFKPLVDFIEAFETSPKHGGFYDKS